MNKHNGDIKCDKCEFSTNHLGSLITHKGNKHNPREVTSKTNSNEFEWKR